MASVGLKGQGDLAILAKAEVLSGHDTCAVKMRRSAESCDVVQLEPMASTALVHTWGEGEGEG